MRSRVAGLGGQETGFFHQFLVVGNQCASTGSSDDLVAIERQDADFPERSQRPPPVSSTQRFGGIFNDRNAKLVGQVHQFKHRRRLPVQMHDNHGFRLSALPDAVFDCLARLVRAQVPCFMVAVHKNRRGVLVHNRVGRCRESERRADHFVARAHAQQDQCQVDGRRARTQRRRMTNARELAQVAFKPVHVRPERGNPVFVESNLDIFGFGAAHVRR